MERWVSIGVMNKTWGMGFMVFPHYSTIPVFQYSNIPESRHSGMLENDYQATKTL
jgi:hypothetical protein